MCDVEEDFDEEMRRVSEEWGAMVKQAEEAQEEVKEEEEGHRPKIAAKTGQPTAQEVKEHMATHIPFRSWCAHCVAGKGKTTQHRVEKNKDREIPEVSVDYMFMESGRDQ